nr:concanavalin A-like lectin/glucanase, subgroup [Tanacetum cinerariifolium]
TLRNFNPEAVLKLISSSPSFSSQVQRWAARASGGGDKTKVPEKEELIFEETKRKLMVNLAAQAAKGNQIEKYSKDAAAFGSEILYMAMQCTPDLSQDTCNECFLAILFTIFSKLFNIISSTSYAIGFYFKLQTFIK